MSIATNIAQVRERISAAAKRAGRDPSAITLMAVSKTFPPEPIREAYAAGIRVFGENRVQEFEAKSEALPDLSGAEWHLIGHLQSNKATKAAELFHAIDSIDSVKLGEKLNAAAALLGKTLPVLIEINIGGEEAKSGVALATGELEFILAAAPNWHNLELRGLMIVPPFGAHPGSARPYFRRLREIRDEILASHADLSLNILSMGMSHDFEVAIEEGSTCVRIGTAIFGERAKI